MRKLSVASIAALWRIALALLIALTCRVPLRAADDKPAPITAGVRAPQPAASPRTPTPETGDKTPARITLREGTRAIFDDSVVPLHADVHLDASAGAVEKTKLVWRHAAESRTLSADESAIDNSRLVEINLRVPPIKEGTSLETQLTLTLVDESGKPLATLVRDLWLLDSNPFALRAAWLKELKLSVFDPIGRTADALSDIGVPFTKLSALVVVDRLDAGILIVGEGVDLAKISALGPALIASAARGLPIVLLAPAAGELPYPALPGPAPLAVRFERDRIVTELDKRLSAGAWNWRPKTPVRRFKPTAGRSELLLQLSSDAADWPWVEITYPRENKLILCGYPIIQTWNMDPTGRYLLARILERLEVPKKAAGE